MRLESLVINNVICHMIKGMCRRISGGILASKWNSLEAESLGSLRKQEKGTTEVPWEFLPPELSISERTGTEEPGRPGDSSLAAVFHSELCPLSSEALGRTAGIQALLLLPSGASKSC